MVVTKYGVIGRYLDLEQAKDMLQLQLGIRLIAEVHDRDHLMTDPHSIAGKPQIPEAGFNKAWGDWDDIKALMAIAEKFLESFKGTLVKLLENFLHFYENQLIISIQIFHLLFTACHVSLDCDEWSFCYNGYCLKKGSCIKIYAL